MNEKEAERAAREYMAGITVATIDFQFTQLAELAAHMTPEQRSESFFSVSSTAQRESC